MPRMRSIEEAPAELRFAVMEFWPSEEWNNAVSVAWLESRWNAFALADTTDVDHPCGTALRIQDGVMVAAERSVGYFQINTCNLPPEWEWQRLYNARHNAGTAHKLWSDRGESWSPWLFSARDLGLL